MASQRHLLTLFFVCFYIWCRAQDIPPVKNIQSNTISVIPLQFSENGLGFGGAYERSIDKKDFIAFCIPVVVTFDVANSNRIYDYNTGNYKTGKAGAVYYAMPGIKYYPTSCHGKIKYAVGLSVVAATGQKSSNLTDLHGLNVTENVQSHFMTGGMVQNSLNFNAGKNVIAGVELGVGSSLTNEVGNVKQGNEFLIQGSFKIGYRF